MARLQKKKNIRKSKIKSKAVNEPLHEENLSAQKETQAGPGEQKKKPQEISRRKAGGTRALTIGRSDGVINRSLQFLREVKVELKKVTWPTRKQTMASTAVVIVLVFIISGFLFVADAGLSNLVRIVLK